MLDYQKRVVAEKEDLDDKAGKLLDFFGTAAYANLPKEDQSLMMRQYQQQMDLSDTLGQRISRFPRPRRLIGLHGRAGAGKDTVANMMVEMSTVPTGCAGGFMCTSFAFPVKEAAAQLFRLEDRHELDPHGNDIKATFDSYWGMTVREIYQKFATEAMRQVFGDDFWIKLWKLHLNDYPNRDVVVTDVRFENEADAIREMGGVIVHIERPGDKLLQGQEAAHASEAGIARGMRDYVIYNSGTLDDLRVQVEKLLTYTQSTK